MHKNLPNRISILRIILSVGLLFVIDYKVVFSGIVLLVGISDVADGYIARKYNMVTKKGAQLDSIADLVFFAVIFFVVLVKYWWILTNNLPVLIIIFGIKILTNVISKMKFGEYALLHTVANKVIGVIIFLFVLTLPFEFNGTAITWVFILAIIPAIEELGIILYSKKFNPDQKSIFDQI